MIITNILLWFLDLINQRKQPSLFGRIVNCFIAIIVFLIIGSGVFYWYILKQTSVSPNLDIWAVSLDITLAYLVLFIPLVIIAYILVFRFVHKLAWGVYIYFSELLARRIDINNIRPELSCFLAMYLLIIFYLPIIGLALYGIYLLFRLFFIDTVHLQNFLFGGFDARLGWSYPTTFRFTNLFLSVENYISIITNNSTLAIILSFLTIAFTSFTAIAVFYKLVSDFEAAIKKKSKSE